MGNVVVVALLAFVTCFILFDSLVHTQWCPRFRLGGQKAAKPEPVHYCFKSTDVLPRSSVRVAGIDKVYIIHWSRLKERKQLMINRLDMVLQHGWQHHNFVAFVDRYDAEDLSHVVTTCFAQDHSTRMTKGAMSVTTKHHVAYHDAVVHGYAAVLILEDDVDFAPGSVNLLQSVTNALPPDWSNCFVSGCMHGGYGVQHCNGSLLCRQPRGIGSNCAYGYLVSLLGAKQMLASMPIRSTPDFQMNMVSAMLPFVTYMSNQTTGIIFENATGIPDGTWQTSIQLG